MIYTLVLPNMFFRGSIGEMVDGYTFRITTYYPNAWINVTQGPSIGGNLKW